MKISLSVKHETTDRRIWHDAESSGGVQTIASVETGVRAVGLVGAGVDGEGKHNAAYCREETVCKRPIIVSSVRLDSMKD
jgi:hypothetical protein